MVVLTMTTLAHPAHDARLERYRVHQKNVYQKCVEDARLLVKRASVPGDPDALVPALALALFDKRCEPWVTWRESAEA